MLDRIIGRLKIAAIGKNELFGSLQTHCDIVTHLLTKLQPIIESTFYICIISLCIQPGPSMTSQVCSDPSKMVCSDPPRMVCSDPF